MAVPGNEAIALPYGPIYEGPVIAIYDKDHTDITDQRKFGQAH